MAEAPTATAPTAPESAAPLTSLADVEARMAEIQANPSAADPVQGEAPSESSQPTRTPAEQPADPEQGDVPEPGEEDSGADAAPKPGGRFARLREQLSVADQKARAAEERLAQRQQFEQAALSQFVDLVLPDAELDRLRMAAEGGDWEAKQRVDLARQWRRMVTPIADLAHQAARQEFDRALQDLRALDGMDGDTHHKLVTAPTAGDKMKLAWQLAYKAGESTSKERIDALEAEVRTLKTTRAATGAQPASGGNRPNGSGALTGMLGADGLPTEEAIQRARQGAFRTLGST